MKILTTEEVQNHYQQITCAKLKNIEGFTVDPLKRYTELQERQKQNFYHISKSDIFVAVMRKKSPILVDAVAHFQNLTIDLSANDNIV